MKKEYLLITVSMLLSLFIYVFYRTENTVINDLLIHLIPCDRFLAMQKTVSTACPLDELVIYSLPGGLWVFCITLTSKRFFIRFGSRQMPMIFLPLVFSIGLEFCQLIHLTNGRFDLWDVSISLLCWWIAYSLPWKQLGSNNIIYPIKRENAICFATYVIVLLAHVWQ